MRSTIPLPGTGGISEHLIRESCVFGPHFSLGGFGAIETRGRFVSISCPARPRLNEARRQRLRADIGGARSASETPAVPEGAPPAHDGQDARIWAAGAAMQRGEARCEAGRKIG